MLPLTHASAGLHTTNDTDDAVDVRPLFVDESDDDAADWYSQNPGAACVSVTPPRHTEPSLGHSTQYSPAQNQHTAALVCKRYEYATNQT